MPPLSTVADVLFGGQPWIRNAACRDRPDVDFFTGDDTRTSPEPALAVCRTCPVVAPCLDYAISLGAFTTGVWGGTTAPQREQLRRQRRQGGSAAA